MTISLSNLVKQYYVIQDEKKDGPVVINSNKRMEEHFKRLAVLRAEEEERRAREEQEAEAAMQAEFVEGLAASHVDGEELTEGEEGMDNIIPMPAPGPSYDEIVTEATVEADRIVSEAMQQADAIVAEAEEKGRMIFEEQKSAGYAAGEEMVAQEIQNATTQLQMQFQMQTEQLQQEYQAKMSHMEADIVDAIIQVFDRVFHVQFEDQREILLYLITNTMLQVHGDKKFKIYTTADQISFVEEHMQELRDKVGADVEIELMYDGNVAAGGCRIETDHGVFDCGIDTELANIYKSIRALCD